MKALQEWQEVYDAEDSVNEDINRQPATLVLDVDVGDGTKLVVVNDEDLED